VHSDGERLQVVVPVYQNYQDDVQELALEKIKSAFGSDATLVTIEATQAAKAQGAVHCLTLTVPRRLTFFAQEDLDIRPGFIALREQLDASSFQASARDQAQEPGLIPMVEHARPNH
jgi:hypothetical protein